MWHRSALIDVRPFAVAIAFVALVSFAFVPTSASAANVCPAESTQEQCSCPTSGPGVICIGDQLYDPDSKSCYDDVRPCAFNQVMDCNTGACACNTALYPCGGCTAATSVPGNTCTSPINGEYTNQCGACGCPTGTALCSTSNTCVTVPECAPGLTFDPCTGQCTTPYVLRSPDVTQEGFIDVDGGISMGGDLSFPNGKSVRVDGSGVTRMYFGNWASGASGVQFRFYGDADANRLCISGDCITAWNEVNATVTGTPNRVASFNGSGTLGAASQLYTDSSGTRLGIGGAPAYPLHVTGDAYVNGNIGVGAAPNPSYAIGTGTTDAYGVYAKGTTAGGFFADAARNGQAYLGYGDYGVYSSGSSYALTGVGTSYGVHGVYSGTQNANGYLGYAGYGAYATGQVAGVYGAGSTYGVFGKDSDASNNGAAYLGYGDYGVYSSASNSGAFLRGSSYGLYAADSDGSGYAYLGYGDYGASAYGDYAAGYFNERDTGAYAYIGRNGYSVDAGGGSNGVKGTGSSWGVYGGDSDNSGYGYLGYGDYGVTGYGDYMGGKFQELDTGAYAYAGYNDYSIYTAGGSYGVRGYGGTWGVYGGNVASGYGYLGYGDYGVTGYGNYIGGKFQELDTGAYAYAGYNDYSIYTAGGSYGVRGYGSSWGVYGGSVASGYGYLGNGDYGATGYGNYAGGYFKELDTGAYARIGSGNYGVFTTGGTYGTRSQGTTYGVLGEDTDNSGYGYLGYGDYGATGYGNYTGGYFRESDTGSNAFIGYSGYGVYASGSNAGGYFVDADSGSYARIGYGVQGVYSYGSLYGGVFSGGGATAYLGYSGYGLYTGNNVKIGGYLGVAGATGNSSYEFDVGQDARVQGTLTIGGRLYANDIILTSGRSINLGGQSRSSWPRLYVTRVSGSLSRSAISTTSSSGSQYVYCPDSSYSVTGTAHYVSQSCNNYYEPCGTGGFSYVGNYYARMNVVAWKQSSGTGTSTATITGTVICAKLL